MRRRHEKTCPDLGEHTIFGHEEAAALRSDLDAVRAQVRELAERVSAQFTSIAAHAEISREQLGQVRDEARADMERSRETVIKLIEQVRAEASGLHVTGSRPGPSGAAINERFEALEATLDQLAAAVEQCMAQQRRMADTMAAFIDTILAADRHEPVFGLALT
jgi:chromosome segregation ATPase